MDAAAVLATKISAFAGYADQDARRLADEQVRSYLGEALALARTRLTGLAPELAARLNDAIMRAAFRNQLAFKVFEYQVLDGAKLERVAQNDLRLLELAERASQLDAAALPAFLDDVARAFDTRDREMQSGEAAA